MNKFNNYEQDNRETKIKITNIESKINNKNKEENEKLLSELQNKYNILNDEINENKNNLLTLEKKIKN